MLLARSSCRFGTLTPEILHILAVVEEYARYHNLLVIALSGTDSQHAVYSGHHEGLAVDLRCNELATHKDRRQFLNEIMSRLGPEFYGTIAHPGEPAEHFHIQLRRGVTFHPLPVATHVARFNKV